MNIRVKRFFGGFDESKCFVHARLCPINEKEMLLTSQYLYTSGSDAFDGINVSKSFDGGETFAYPTPEKTLAAEFSDGHKRVFCDAAHIRLNKYGCVLTVGIAVTYFSDGITRDESIPNYSFYAVYDDKKGCYGEAKKLDIPESATFGLGGVSGCAQFVEEDGDVLIPVSCIKPNGKADSAVFRYSFDGEELKYLSRSNFVEFDGDEQSRGLYEPSLCKFNGKYYLTLRNDGFGFYSISDDGKTFGEPKKWCWDTGLLLPTYNTQSHWLILKYKLYLVYTRKCGSNDHVFRHRAPLFIAEVNVEENSLSVLHSTEKIAVPERGARLGNFGVMSINGNLGIISVSEWMQPKGCEKYGADNSFWISFVTPEE